MATALRRVWPGRHDVWLLLAAATATFPFGLALPMMRVEKLLLGNELSVLSGIVALFQSSHWGLFVVAIVIERLTERADKAGL